MHHVTHEKYHKNPASHVLEVQICYTLVLICPTRESSKKKKKNWKLQSCHGGALTFCFGNKNSVPISLHLHPHELNSIPITRSCYLFLWPSCLVNHKRCHMSAVNTLDVFFLEYGWWDDVLLYINSDICYHQHKRINSCKSHDAQTKSGQHKLIARVRLHAGLL